MPTAADGAVALSHLHAEVDQLHLGQLDWVDQPGERGSCSANARHSVNVHIIAMSFRKLHFRQRDVEDILATQRTCFNLNVDVISKRTPSATPKQEVLSGKCH